MEKSLQGKTIALVATNGFEDSELVKPNEAITDAGASVTVISLETGKIVGKNGTEVRVDATIDGVRESDFDGLLLPGGVVNPDILRTNKDVVAFVRAFFDAKKPVGAICHAPWTLIEADVVKGRTLTSWPSLTTDLKNAGAIWIDKEVVVDDNLVTSRKPDDIPAFSANLIEILRKQ